MFSFNFELSKKSRKMNLCIECTQNNLHKDVTYAKTVKTIEKRIFNIFKVIFC